MGKEEIKAAREKHRLIEEKAFAHTDEERMNICDMGFNYSDGLEKKTYSCASWLECI